MSDITLSFNQPDFDPKSWINDTLTKIPPDQSLDSFLVEMEMKLQLHMEDVEFSLDQTSSAVLDTIPLALKEISRITGAVKKLKGEVKRITDTLADTDARAAPAVSDLVSLDLVKTRMDLARNTLREAASLGEMLHSVEDVFSTGNYKTLVTNLASMRRSLSIVGADLPEFRGASGRLAALEERLVATVETRLTQALASNQEERVRELVDVLLTMQPSVESLERIYLNAKLPLLRDAWEAVGVVPHVVGGGGGGGGGGNEEGQEQYGWFREQLVHYYDFALDLVTREYRTWLSILHAEHIVLSMLSKLLVNASRHIGATLESRLDAIVSTTTLPAKSGMKRVDVAFVWMRHTDEFLIAVTKLFSSTRGDEGCGVGSSSSTSTTSTTTSTTSTSTPISSPFPLASSSEKFISIMDSLRAATAAIAAPLQSLLVQQASWEKTHLLHTASTLSSSIDANPTDMEATARIMAESLPHLLDACRSSMDRSLALSGGASLQSLLHVVDEVIGTFLVKCSGSISMLEGRIRQILRKAMSNVETHAAANTTTPSSSSSSSLSMSLEDAARVTMELSDLNTQILPLLSLLRVIRNRLDRFVATIRTSLLDAIPVSLQRTMDYNAILTSIGSSGSSGALTSGVLSSVDRVVSSATVALLANVASSRSLEGLLATLRDSPSVQLTPQSDARYKQLQSSIHALVQDTMLARVRAGLHRLSTLPVWRDDSSSSTSTSTSTSTSMNALLSYPLPQITVIGEYLMNLPQLFDSISSSFSWAISDEGEAAMEEDEVGRMAASWLDRIAHMTAEMYGGELKRIASLSNGGAAQLLADVEYFGNVLHALGVEVPPSVAAWGVLLRVGGGDGWVEAVRTAVEQGVVEQGMADHVGRVLGRSGGKGV